MKRRFFLPLIAYFIGWFYWKTVLGPWPVLIYVAAFFAWGMPLVGRSGIEALCTIFGPGSRR